MILNGGLLAAQPAPDEVQLNFKKESKTILKRQWTKADVRNVLKATKSKDEIKAQARYKMHSFFSYKKVNLAFFTQIICILFSQKSLLLYLVFFFPAPVQEHKCCFMGHTLKWLE